MNIKDITTSWQSLDLMQAGMDKQTADYVYSRFHCCDEGFTIPRPRTDYDYFCTDVIPAWSMGRLWDFFLENGWTYEFATNLTSTEVIQKLVEGIIKKLKK